MTPARFLPLAFLAAGASAALGQVNTALPGWTITTNMTVDSGTGGHPWSMAMRQQVTPRNLRMEFVQLSGYSSPISIEGMYMIFDAVDSTMTSVMPAQHMATIMGFGMLNQMKTPMVATEQNLTRSDIEDLGDGGQVRGHATHHYRTTTAGTMTMLMGGEKCTSTPIDGVTDMWIAPDVDLGPAAEAAATHVGALGGASITPNQRGIAPAKMPKGTALKSISRRAATDATGRAITITTTTEVVDFSHTNLDPSLFAVPPDLQAMDMRKLMADLPAGVLDSVTTANAGTENSAAHRICSR